MGTISRIREDSNHTTLSSNNKVEKSDVSSDMVLDPYILELICKMLVTDNKTVRRSQLINLENLINIINPNKYINDPVKSRFMSFIRKGLEARLVYNLNDPQLVMHHINGGILDDSIVDVNTFRGIGGNEVNWINNMVSSTLKYSHLYDETDHLIDVCTRFKTKDYVDKSFIVQELEGLINKIQNDFRRSRNESHTEAMFSLAEEVYEDSVYDAYNQLSSPRRKLVTGMQGLNEMLGGGFESGRCYMFFGLPGEGKSLLLLNLVYQIKKYNVDYTCKDPTKTPCVVLLTMENTITESIERLFSISTTRDSMVDFDPKDVINMMKVDGGLVLDRSSPINIIIKFKPTNSVDTSYLYTLTEDLEDMGYETIAVVQDYIGRIRSTEKFTETRLEYGTIVDEFKVFAEIKDIPVISASQLNRDASKHIDEGRKKNTADLVRFLGRSNISESILILNNIDGGFVIAPELTQTGDRYLGIQRIKNRYRASGMEYAYLPYKRGTVSFVEDFGMPEPVYKTTLREDIYNNSYPGACSHYHTNAICDMDQVTATDEENIFKDATVISSMTEHRALDTLDEIAIRQETIMATYHPIVFDPIVIYR